jgi:hypothetical protein
MLISRVVCGDAISCVQLPTLRTQMTERKCVIQLYTPGSAHLIGLTKLPSRLLNHEHWHITEPFEDPTLV